MNTPDDRGAGRSGHTGRDMLISLIVLLLPLAAIVAIFRLRGGEATTVVDPAPVFAQARAVARFSVVEPRDLPPAWRCVSATFDRGQDASASSLLRVGYLTPTNGQVQLIETNELLEPLLQREFAGRSSALGTVTIGAASWQQYDVRVGEQALVLSERGRTIVVIGRADAAELQFLAGSLR